MNAIQEPPIKTEAPPKQSVLAAISDVLGLASLFLGILTEVPAIVLGHIAIFKVSRSDGRLTGRSLRILALVMGYFALALYIFRPIP
jgi:cyanate permease